MKVLSKQEFNIKSIEDNSDSFLGLRRARITFENGYELSVISGEFAYCDVDRPFEIAVYDPRGGYCTRELCIRRFDDDPWDDVLGYQTVEDVRGWAAYIGGLR